MRKLYLILLIMGACFFTTEAQDWANLERFREANEKLPPSLECDDRVVFMGNSITQGWIDQLPEFFAPEKHYINRGISGQTTPQMLLRFRQDVINLRPKVVVILAGTNDIAGNTGPSTLEMIEDNIRSMTELAQANGIQVVLCSIVPAYDYPWKPGLEPAPKIMELNNRIKKYASTRGAVYCDYFSAMADDRNGLPAELSGDGVHPNKKGYAIMQPIVENAIARALLMWTR
ncbi:MAG: SGNH/GDSL hydrolase family protein [Fermentimonas sp.]|nr:SGNH/GDSL hydrolase family protein [Fermentimonas sp.]